MQTSHQEARFFKMTTSPVRPLILRLSIPIIIGFLRTIRAPMFPFQPAPEGIDISAQNIHI